MRQEHESRMRIRFLQISTIQLWSGFFAALLQLAARSPLSALLLSFVLQIEFRNKTFLHGQAQNYS